MKSEVKNTTSTKTVKEQASTNARCLYLFSGIPAEYVCVYKGRDTHCEGGEGG